MLKQNNKKLLTFKSLIMFLLKIYFEINTIKAKKYQFY